MLSPRMSTLPSPPSRPRGASSLLTGVPLVSRLVSTTSLPLLYLAEILLRSRELSFTGMSERVWRRESSLRPGRIWLLLRRITRRLELTPLMPPVREMMEVNTRFLIYLDFCISGCLSGYPDSLIPRPDADHLLS